MAYFTRRWEMNGIRTTALVALASLAVLAQSASAVVIYQDSLKATPDTSLGGTAPDTRATTVAGGSAAATWTVSGTITQTAAGGVFGASAYAVLPSNGNPTPDGITGGYLYTLSANLGSTASFQGLGFSTNVSGISDVAGQSAKRAWVAVNATSDAAALYYNHLNQVGTTFFGLTNSSYPVTIYLDTTTANAWKIQAKVGTSTTPVYTYDAANSVAANFRYLFFGASNEAGTRTDSDFLFTAVQGTEYTLDAGTSSLNILKGGSLDTTSTITNIGTDATIDDALNFTGLSGTTGNAGVATVSGSGNGNALAVGGGNASQNIAIAGLDYGSTTVTASVTTATNTTFRQLGGSPTTNATLSGSPDVVNVVVGNATTNGTSLGTALSALIPNSSSYAGLESRTSDTAANGVGTDVVESGATVYGTVAKILDGGNASGIDQTTGMAWRAQTTGDTADGLVSDVVDLSNVTDTYVLQMTYDPNLVLNDAVLAASGLINVSWNNGGNWVNAGNSYQGDVAWNNTFTTVGQWGVDTANNVAWVVLDHNSEFGVQVQPVPEPATFIMLLFGLLGLGRWRGKRNSGL
jgi:hypothetical protein